MRRPKISERVDHEGELGVVIGKTCYQPAADADIRQYILGYTCVNDVTARDLQNKDGQWTRAKGFDTFCPVGPVVTDEIDPWAGVGVETRVNGEVRQQGNTRDFIFRAGRGDSAYCAGDDLVSGRLDSERNACGSGAAGGGGCGGGQRGRSGDAAEFGGG